MTLYKIVRCFYNENMRHRTIETGLYLEEARAHCKDPQTRSKTATSAQAMRYTKTHGAWFDSYEAM